MSLVPADFTIIGDAEDTASLELDGDGEVLSEDGEDAFFGGFGIHEGECIVVLEHDNADVEAPDLQEGPVDDVGEGALGIIGDGFLEELLVRRALEEIAAASGQGGELAFGLQFV